MAKDLAIDREGSSGDGGPVLVTVGPVPPFSLDGYHALGKQHTRTLTPIRTVSEKCASARRIAAITAAA